MLCRAFAWLVRVSRPTATAFELLPTARRWTCSIQSTNLPSSVPHNGVRHRRRRRANAKHWHGASATTAMTHAAIQERLDGRFVDWMEQVSDAQYGQ